MKAHWSCTCCTLKHLLELYEASLKYKEKDIETKFIFLNDDFDDDNMEIKFGCLRTHFGTHN